MTKHQTKKTPKEAKLGSGLAGKASSALQKRKARNRCALKGMGYDQSTGKCSGGL